MSPELSAFRIQPPELERTSHLQGTMLLEVISCKWPAWLEPYLLAVLQEVLELQVVFQKL